MSSRIKKDLINLRVESGIAAVLTTAPIFIFLSFGWSATEFLPFHLALLAVTSSWLGAGILGKDISVGLLAFSFAHLESRTTLWKEKIQTGLLHIGILFVLSMGTLLLVGPQADSALDEVSRTPTRVVGLIFIGLLISLTSLGGGLFFSLTLRSYQGAFWMTLLAPAAIAVAIIFPIILTPLATVPSAYWSLVIVALLVYGITLTLLGHQRFHTWQDLGTWGGDIWLSFNQSKNPSQKTKRQIRQYRPLLALFRKELYLQHLNIMIAIALMALYGISASLYDTAAQRPEGAALFAYFCRLVLLIFLPLAIGATAISEERRLRVNQWQQTIPSSAFLQWITKAGCIYLVCFIATAIVPLGIDSFFQDFWSRVTESLGSPLVAACLIPLLATTLGFYASSLSKSFLVALGTSALLALIAAGLYLLTLQALLKGITMNAMALPQLLLAILLLMTAIPLTWWLTYQNYQEKRPIHRAILSNGFSWLLLFVSCGILSHQIYERTWERLTYSPLAPRTPLGPPDVEARILPGYWATVLSPNGTLWTSANVQSWTDESTGTSSISDVMVQMGTDSDWIKAFRPSQNYYAIKRSGKLFKAYAWANKPRSFEAVPDPVPTSPWNTVYRGSRQSEILALKDDGSLWNWSENKEGEITSPTRTLPDFRWKSIARSGTFFVGVRTDNTMWAWGLIDLPTGSALSNPALAEMSSKATQTAQILSSNPDTHSEWTAKSLLLTRALEAPFQVSSERIWSNVRMTQRLPMKDTVSEKWVHNAILIAKKLDGTTWVPTESARTYWDLDLDPHATPSGFVELPDGKIPLQLALSLAGDQEVASQITAGGTLEELAIKQNRLSEFKFTNHFQQRSSRSDWISFHREHYSIIALTADGILWHSGPYPFDRNPGKYLPFLLPASRNLHPVFDLVKGTPL